MTKQSDMAKPIFTIDDIRFEIDNCLPQVSAANKNQIQMHALTHGNYPGKTIPENILTGVSSMGFMHVVQHQDWGIEPHRNEGIEICFQENGSNSMTVNGNKYNIPAKTLTITRPWQLHHVGDPNISPGRLHWVILDVGVRSPNQKWSWPDWCILTEQDKSELELLLRGNEHPAWQANNDILLIFKKLQMYITEEPVEKVMSHIMLLLNQLLLALLELLRSQNIVTEAHLSSQQRAVEIFLQELKQDTDIAGFEWTLPLMAEHCGLARSAFSNYCQQLINTSPIVYLNQCRLQHAAKLLIEQQDYSITNLALDLGFSSSQYFTRCFKQHFGLPPLQWRKHNKLAS